jgi:hypothetical protein
MPSQKALILSTKHETRRFRAGLKKFHPACGGIVYNTVHFMVSTREPGKHLCPTPGRKADLPVTLPVSPA